MKKFKKIFKKYWWTLLIVAVLVVWQPWKKAPLEGDWQEPLKILSTAEFHGDLVTVHNVRNFRYGPTEADIRPDYYDKTYDLRELKKIWFISEPFNEMKYAAHTLLSFEFNNGDFLAITIEARKTKEQKYNIIKGAFKTYPIVYMAADERDVLLLRANVRRDNVYVYPVKTHTPESARVLLTNMLTRMNELTVHPAWYNTLLANCTSSIAKHVNEITPRTFRKLSWQLWFTASADKLALSHDFLDTDLSVDEAREKYLITEKSQEVGDVWNYSTLIRE